MQTDGDWWEQHVYSFDVESITKKKPDSLSVVLRRETYYDKILPLRFGFHSRKTRRFWFTDLQQKIAIRSTSSWKCRQNQMEIIMQEASDGNCRAFYAKDILMNVHFIRPWPNRPPALFIWRAIHRCCSTRRPPTPIRKKNEHIWIVKVRFECSWWPRRLYADRGGGTLVNRRYRSNSRISALAKYQLMSE